MNALSIVVVAGGKGSRMGGEIAKQYIELAGKPILVHTLLNLAKASPDSEFILVVPAEDTAFVEELLKTYNLKAIKVTSGGQSRAESVYNGLQLAQRDYVAVHDAVRPFVTPTLFHNLMDALSQSASVIPAVSSIDSVRLLDGGDTTRVVDREKVLMVQTPQCFRRDYLTKAYQAYFATPLQHLTDDASIVEHFCQCSPKVVAGDYNNIKITTPKDLAIAHFILENR